MLRQNAHHKGIKILRAHNSHSPGQFIGPAVQSLRRPLNRNDTGSYGFIVDAPTEPVKQPTISITIFHSIICEFIKPHCAEQQYPQYPCARCGRTTHKFSSNVKVQLETVVLGAGVRTKCKWIFHILIISQIPFVRALKKRARLRIAAGTVPFNCHEHACPYIISISIKRRLMPDWKVRSHTIIHNLNSN